MEKVNDPRISIWKSRYLFQLELKMKIILLRRNWTLSDPDPKLWANILAWSWSPQPCPTIPGLCLTLVALTGPDPEPHLWVHVLSQPWCTPVPRDVPNVQDWLMAVEMGQTLAPWRVPATPGPQPAPAAGADNILMISPRDRYILKGTIRYIFSLRICINSSNVTTLFPSPKYHIVLAKEVYGLHWHWASCLYHLLSEIIC